MEELNLRHASVLNAAARISLTGLLLLFTIFLGCGSSDKDADGDGVGGNADNCPAVSNPGQENLDGDAFGDVCDDDLPPSTPTGTWDDTEWDRSKWGEWHPPIDSCLTQRMLVPCNLRSRRS